MAPLAIAIRAPASASSKISHPRGSLGFTSGRGEDALISKIPQKIFTSPSNRILAPLIVICLALSVTLRKTTS